MASSAEQKEKTILFISFFAGLLFAVLEFIFAILTGSQSVLMDSLYDASELVFIVFILFLTPLFHKPISEKRPYGFFQVESIVITVKNFMMLSVTAGVSAQVIGSALSGGNPVNGLYISFFQLSLGLLSVIVLFIMNRYNKALSSPTVSAEILGWRIDVCYSLGLSCAFFISLFLEKTPLKAIAPYFDQIVAVAIIILTLPEIIRMLISSIGEIFLFSPDEHTMNTIKEICQSNMPRWGFEPVFFDITKTGRRIWASVYFISADNMLSITELKSATDEISCLISKKLEGCSLELIASPSENFPIEQEIKKEGDNA